MRDLLLYALDLLQGQHLTYADVRYRKERRENIWTMNEILQSLSQREEEGIAIRVLFEGCWGFAATGDLTRRGVAGATAKALTIAKAAARFQLSNIRLAEDTIPACLSFRTPVEIDPFAVGSEEKLAALFKIYDEAKAAACFKRLDAHLDLRTFQQQLFNLEGAQLANEVTLNEITYTVTVVDGYDFQSRTFYGIPKSAGYEWIIAQTPHLHARRIAEEALSKLRAPAGPYGKKDLILLPSHLYLTIHESVGHPTELDRVLGQEADYAGTSFATLEKLGNFHYASPLVNFEANNLLEGGLATQGFDDDGIPSKQYDVIKDGVLVGYNSTRETAAEIGLRESMGCNRADSFSSMPINRIPNLSLKAGTAPLSLEELIADTEDGILIDGRGSFSIDQQRLNFQFGGDYFLAIKGGKVQGPLRDVTYQAITPQFWQSCDAICDQRFWQPYGTLNCGKGAPPQVQQMSHGSSPARFRNIMVGGALNG